MKLINQFIRKHISDFLNRIDSEEAKSIYGDIVEIWDNFSDAYQWQGEQIAPPFEIIVFYAYLKPINDFVNKYANVFEIQSEVEIIQIDERIKGTDITDDKAVCQLKEYIYEKVEKMGIKDFYDELMEIYNSNDFCEEFDKEITSMNSIIDTYYCWLFGFPQVTNYLIDSIEHCFIMDSVSLEYENSIYKPNKKPRFDGYVNLKNIDIKKLYEILNARKYISEMSIEDFCEVLSTPHECEKRINWNHEEYAAACAKLIFKKYPMMCAEIKFSVQNKILNNRQYTDAKNKKLVPRKEERFKEELREALIDI